MEMEDDMTERQQQGFALEQICDEHMPYLCLSDEYTSQDDAIYILHDGHEIGVSIKSSTANGEICLGSMSRIIRSTEPLLLIYGVHKRKVFQKISAYILPNGWRTIFPSASDVLNECDIFENYMKGISTNDYLGNDYNADMFHSHEYDAEWRLNLKQFKQDYHDTISSTHGNFIYVRPKRDHKKQARLQAAIPANMRDCLEPLLVSSNDKPYDKDEWADFINDVDNALMAFNRDMQK